MNIQKNNIYNQFNLIKEVCKFVYPTQGPRYEYIWKKANLLPLFNDEKKINDNFETGDIIFADNYYMKDFKKDFSDIKKPFILVSVDSDNTAPYGDFNNKCEDILDHPFLIKWFSINVGIHHHKLSPIPIGICKDIPFIVYDPNNDDFYMGWTIHHNTHLSKDILYHFMDYDNNNLRNNFIEDKQHLLYTRMTIQNSQNNLHEYKNIRKNILNSWESKGLPIQYDKLNQLAYFKDLRNYKMCLSLPGAGLDCFRTWECLFLGVVPIVLKTQGNNTLFEDLPVICLTLEELENITTDILYEHYIKVLKKIFKNEIKWEKLSLSYWVSHILKERFNFLVKIS